MTSILEISVFYHEGDKFLYQFCLWFLGAWLIAEDIEMVVSFFQNNLFVDRFNIFFSNTKDDLYFVENY